MPRVPCPKCGYENPLAAAYCTLCQTVFKREVRPGPRPAAPEGRRDFYTEQSANVRRCFLLMAVFVLLVVSVGWGIGAYYGVGPYGLLFGLCGGSIGSIAAFYTGDRLVLQASGAREVSPEVQPILHNVVEELCLASGLPKPRLHVIDSSAPNAFATGRDPEHASVAVTRGLLEKMNREELQGVLAHEMSHIRNLDVRFATIVGVLVGTVALMCDGFWRSARFGRRGRWGGRGGAPLVAALALLLAVLAPLASRLIQMAMSRRRELLADATAVELTRNPLGLASALRKIDSDRGRLEVANRATQHMYIVNPVRSFGMSSSALFSTHPPIQARIRILESMG